MKNSVDYKRFVHFSLFILVVAIQVAIIFLWKDQNESESKLAQSYKNASERNLIFEYSNQVAKNYFTAENSFIEYLHDYNPKSLEQYQNSLTTMVKYLDSLSANTKSNEQFSENVAVKKNKEKEVIELHKKLDILINSKTDFRREENLKSLKITPYNQSSVLNSITYDTLTSSEKKPKKGFFGRIGDAVAGNATIEKQEVQIKMQMKFGTINKSGTIEEQMTNIFNATDRYYQNEFKNLRKTYTNLRNVDKELLSINKKILQNTQDIILFYNRSSHNLDEKQFQNSVTDLQNKRSTILYLIAMMAFCTFLLLAYSIYSYYHEKKLALAKIQAERNVEFKNRIIGMLSHEMRSPLNIISNLTQKLNTKNLNIDENKTLNLLNFTSNSLQITVNQVLDFFKNESSELVLYNSKINLKEEIDTILTSLKSLASAKNIDLIKQIDPSLETEVWADYGKIHQLFYNLIGNALKFTNKGKIDVQAKLKVVGEKFKLNIKIKDTGVGIPPEDIDKVFDKYYQSSNFKEQISFGAGLGLNLCKEIVELHGGNIEVKSILNEGTEVSFYLFLERIENKKSTQTKLISKFNSDLKKVAIVDDDILVTTILKKMFQKINFDTIIFNSGEEILDYLKTESADLIISDLQIGNYSGVQLIREIKAFNNLNSKIPIIAITGDANISKVDSKSIGANEILIKPVDKEELYSKVFDLMK